ncbi:hypothetical protein CPIN18021_0320 [Campylobacter pinnipediorum subsp. caledonicus]|uniref:Resolvase n=1 Tax=Campylobacter pinnipediorum subsp. caledonicus TaxID=1874362 RepID=A0A1S6U6T7_9BACT|nr:hypothetical protein [Campylobacter pinnipediorum]AQW87167.1 hypothetical protein CPIN18021_0320 [Campylobacter pinnipediorum subsp. caledonicus]
MNFIVKTRGKKENSPKIGLNLDWKFEYIRQNISLGVIRDAVKLNDEDLSLVIASMICEITSGIKYIPKKKAKVELVKRLIKKGVCKDKVMQMTGVSKSTYFNIKKKEQENGKERD